MFAELYSQWVKILNVKSRTVMDIRINCHIKGQSYVCFPLLSFPWEICIHYYWQNEGDNETHTTRK